MISPHQYFKDDHPVMLDEVTYKDMIHSIDGRDLPHRDYAPLIPYVRYQDTERDISRFFVPNGHNGWMTYFRWMQWYDVVNDQSLNPVDAARLLIWSGDLQLHCGCPAYSFYGANYILTQLGAAIYPETRFPHIKNPQLKGIACKHLRRAIKVLPFQSGKIATAIKQQRLSR